ncbi:response regulator [Desulfobacula toluolica]|uniref:Two component system response regulator n=1 Tax=Desulfobacula toluolica (strain DSM 7467 / Tol2) TaxID=651182 RepID=K0NFD3_DESTT|nr:response regulator [Desulfobacula toluolica]CCK79831.1 two component system response regulator [Desulfobacula toluolica Tol2]
MIDIDNMSILVVDDMKSMRLTIRKMVKNLGIGTNLKFAENGKQGLDILKNEHCDLAILDWNMPVMNGIEMLDKIRNDKKLRDLPVIMVTAEAERDIVSEVAETEIDGYLLKPLTLESLDTKIKTVVEKANNPDPATLHRLKARDLEEKEQYEAAIEEIKLALSHKPSASRLLRQLGLLHFKIEKNAIAEKCLLKAASVNKQDAISRIHLADYYSQNKELEKAGKYCLEVLSLTNQYNEQAFDLGEKLLKKDFRQLSLNIFSKFITRSKRQSAARQQVIDVCLFHNEFEYPQELLERVIKDNPSNYEMIYKAGLIHKQVGEWAKALKCFMEVDRQAKGHIEAKFQIAKIHCMNKKIFVADDYLNQILRIDPKNEAAIELRKKI